MPPLNASQLRRRRPGVRRAVAPSSEPRAPAIGAYYDQPAAGSRAGGELVRAALLALLLGGACVFDGLSRRQAGQKPTRSGRSRPRRGPARHPGEPQRAPRTGRVNLMVARTRQLPVALRRPGGAAPYCKSCVL